MYILYYNNLFHYRQLTGSDRNFQFLANFRHHVRRPYNNYPYTRVLAIR